MGLAIGDIWLTFISVQNNKPKNDSFWKVLWHLPWTFDIILKIEFPHVFTLLTNHVEIYTSTPTMGEDFVEFFAASFVCEDHFSAQRDISFFVFMWRIFIQSSAVAHSFKFDFHINSHTKKNIKKLCVKKIISALKALSRQ